MEQRIEELEFNFLDESGEVVFDLRDAVVMAAFFNCFKCGRVLHFRKEYQPVPLHCETLLKICAPVECPKCKITHEHFRDDEGEENVRLLAEPDPNQLSIF